MNKKTILAFLTIFFILISYIVIRFIVPSSNVSGTKNTIESTATAFRPIKPKSTSTQKHIPAIGENIFSRLLPGQYLIYNTDKLFAFSPKDNSTIILSESLDPRKTSLSFSPDGRFVAYQDIENLVITMFDMETNSDSSHTLNQECQEMAVSPSGEWVACGAGEIYLYSLADQERYWLTPHDSDINQTVAWYGPAFSPDNNWLAYKRISLGYEKTMEDGLYITDLACIKDIKNCDKYTRGPFLSSLDLYEPFSWSPDGNDIAIITPKTIIIFTPSTQNTSSLTNHSLALDVAWSPNGEWIAFTGDGINLISPPSGESIKVSDYSGKLGWIMRP